MPKIYPPFALLPKLPLTFRRSFNFSTRFLDSFKMGDALKKQINLLRGWPNPSLLPTSQIKAAANAALSDASVSTPGLLYGPDPGYQPLRQSIAQWLDDFYRHSTPAEGNDIGPDAERICITGGASQNLACVLQVFTDPVFTKVFMVAPCYFLACRIFEDAGLKTRAIAEGEEGVDLESLEKALKERERETVGKVSKLLSYEEAERENEENTKHHVMKPVSLWCASVVDRGTIPTHLKIFEQLETFHLFWIYSRTCS